MSKNLHLHHYNAASEYSFIHTRFIGPFLPVVQRLEQSLSSVSGVFDEWLNVQAKWLYLEGVFIGGDIREQLPDEAKKFDDIDRHFIRVIHFTTH